MATFRKENDKNKNTIKERKKTKNIAIKQRWCCMYILMWYEAGM